MSKVISSFRSLRAKLQVVALLLLCLCVILHTMLTGKSMQLLCILPCGVMCLSAISMMYVKIILMYVCGYCGLSESELCVFGKLCPVGFLVVCNIHRFFFAVCSNVVC